MFQAESVVGHFKKRSLALTSPAILKNKTPISTKHQAFCWSGHFCILKYLPSLFLFSSCYEKWKKGKILLALYTRWCPHSEAFQKKNAPLPNLRSALILRMPHSSNITLHVSRSQPNLPFPCTLGLLVVEKIPLSKFQILSSS